MYPRNMTDLISLIEIVDAELETKGIPIPHRTLEALGKISQTLGNIELPLVKFDRPPDPNCFEPKELTWHIYCWYEKRYGNKLRFDWGMGRVAFYLRGDVWFMRMPRIYGFSERDVLNLVDDLTDDLRCSLTEAEKAEIRKIFEGGYEALFYLEMKCSYKYVVESLSDHRTAVDHLKPPNPHPPSLNGHRYRQRKKLLRLSRQQSTRNLLEATTSLP